MKFYGFGKITIKVWSKSICSVCKIDQFQHYLFYINGLAYKSGYVNFVLTKFMILACAQIPIIFYFLLGFWNLQSLSIKLVWPMINLIDYFKLHAII